MGGRTGRAGVLAAARGLTLAGLVALGAPSWATGPMSPAKPDVTVEFSWLLADEATGNSRLVSGPPPIGAAEVLYTVRFSYPGTEPADGLRIELPLPDGMRYVADSATGPGADISYSVDGRVFAPADELRMPAEAAEAGDPMDPGSPPAFATADDYGFIRWDLPGEFPPGVTGLVSFRARPVDADLGEAPPASAESPVTDDAPDPPPFTDNATDPPPAPEAP